MPLCDRKELNAMKKKPNIILFLADDLGYGDVSCMNPESKIHTKHVDRLAQEGMRFTDCHASSAVCSPSRYALLTGRYNWRSELKRLVLPGVARPLIEDGRETIASMLKKQGYRTACVGKWHLGMEWQTVDNTELTIYMPLVDKRRADLGLDYTKPIKNGPNAKGFDYFFGMAASLDQAPYLFIENDRALAVPDCTIGSDDCDHATPGTEFLYDKGPAYSGFDLRQAVPICDQKVLDLVDAYAKEDEPFFLYYPSLAVHAPLLPAEEYQGKSVLGAYGDFVLQVDAFIGRLMDKLEQNGIADNTIVIFTSDNGCSAIVGFEELAKLGHHPSYIFRGSKSDIWEGGHRVPLVIRWPEKIAPATTCSQTMCLVDFFATFAEITGYQIPDNAAEDSYSNLPLWLGSQESLREATVHHSHFGSFSIRKGDWKLEMCNGSGGGTLPNESPSAADLPPVQLYHLSEDIGETTNVYKEYPEKVEELKALLSRYILDGRSTPGAPQENFPCENWPGLEWLLQEDAC